MLKREYATKEEIPEAAAAHYVEKGGKWVLGIEGVDELTTRLSEFRENNNALKTRAAKADADLLAHQKKYDDVDIVQYRKLQEQIDKMGVDEEKQLIQAGKIDEVVARRTATAITAAGEKLKAKSTALEEMTIERNTLSTKLGSHLIEQKVQVEISNQGLTIKPQALSDILSRTNRRWKIDKEGNETPVGSDGKTVFGEKGETLKMTEFVKTELLGKAPHLFAAAKGGGGDGSDRTPPADGKLRIQRDDEVTKSRHIKELADGSAVLVD